MGETVRPPTRKPARRARAPAVTVRSTSGAGFAFEDLVQAWLWVKSLSGEPIVGLSSAILQVQSQTGASGWEIDDLLITSAPSDSGSTRLAVSCKGNLQVSASGLPTDFAQRAWRQWLRQTGPFNAATDQMVLVTRGRHAAFDAAWHEVKLAADGQDAAFAIQRIRAAPSQARIFDGLKNAAPEATTDEATLRLIQHLQVVPVDFQQTPSEFESQAIGLCRRMLVSGDAVEG